MTTDRSSRSELELPEPHKRRAMQAQREHDTGPELLLRRTLHSRGLRYYVHRRLLSDLRREADVVFPRARLAVFVDGCFWHSCPQHRTSPARNGGWWSAKLERNRTRDADTDRRLRDAGWVVVRVWEHEGAGHAADRIEALLKAYRGSGVNRSEPGRVGTRQPARR
jgi:DNA mismatch endonuclease (patch repair protein)